MSRRGVVIFPEEFNEYWMKLLESTTINVLGIHPSADKNCTIGQAVQQFLTPENRKRIEQLERRGVQVELEMHTLSGLLPRKHFKQHPEWFRMNEKCERVDDYNLCVSSEEALAVISKNAAELARLYRPSSNRYHFWMDDVAVSRCHCPKCSGYSAADAALLVYNAIQRGLRTINLQAQQCYLAYHDTNAVPTLVKPEKGIFLEYAPMIRDFDCSLFDPISEKNAKEIQALPALLAFFGTDGAQVLDYWLDNSLHSGWKKPPKEFRLEQETLRQDVMQYRQLGFDTITSFACYLGEDYFQLYERYPEIDVYARILSEA